MSATKRTVLITGGSKGIGFATAEHCLGEGCRVILIARGLAELESAKEKLINAGHEARDIHIHQADLSEVERTGSWVGELPWLSEGLWGLVPNAAVETLKKVVDYTADEMMAMLRVNVLSPIALIQACHPYLKKVNGNIVYVGSIADQHKKPRYSFYGGTKAFMKSFVGHAGQELGFEGIRINIVSPGATDTELMREMRAAGAWPEDEIRAFEASIPIDQRIGRPSEIAEAIWFALDGPRYLHGEDIRVYGGHS